jgi:hypothetical protein
MQGEIVGGGYPPPVAKLLTLGDPRELRAAPGDPYGWPNYLRDGLGPAQIPDLIRLTRDDVFNNGDPDSREVWGPLHAWRALGQLRAEEAIAPLLDLLSQAGEDDDWVHEELPEVYSLIGATAIPALAAYLADDTRELSNRLTPATALAKLGNLHPDARDASVAALARQLDQFADNDPELNGFLISDLIDLKATEAAPSIQKAFDARAVDLMVAGDWDDVRVALGLFPERIQLTQPAPDGPNRLARRYGLPSLPPLPPLPPALGSNPSRTSGALGTSGKKGGKSRKGHKKRK